MINEQLQNSKTFSSVNFSCLYLHLLLKLQIMDRTEKFIQPGHDVILVVTRIQKVFNPKLQIEFLKAQCDLFQPTSLKHLLFHGTGDVGVEGITRYGFRLPEANKRNMFGQVSVQFILGQICELYL